MIAYRPYFAGDAQIIELSPQQRFEARAGAIADVDARARDGVAYSIIRDGAPIACGGLMPLWTGFYIAWGLAGVLPASAARPLLLAARSALAKVRARRIEVTVRADFAAARRLVEAIGFRHVAVLEQYGPRGEDYLLHAWLGASA